MKEAISCVFPPSAERSRNTGEVFHQSPTVFFSSAAGFHLKSCFHENLRSAGLNYQLPFHVYANEVEFGSRCFNFPVSCDETDEIDPGARRSLTCARSKTAFGAIGADVDGARGGRISP